MAGQKIRIRLKAYDHEVIGQLGEEDRRDGDSYRCAQVAWPRAAADGEERTASSVRRTSTRTAAST